MTPDEFADLVIGVLYESKYFKEGEKYHPEDIFIAMEQIGQAIAMSMDQLQQKIVRKNAEPEELGYSEWKHGRVNL